jgi:hypothetical protein
MGVYKLTTSDKKKELMMEIPFGSEDQDPFLSSQWRSWSRSFLFGASDLDPAWRFPTHLLDLFRRIRVDRRLLLADLSPWGVGTRSDWGSSEESALGSWAKTGVVGIGTSPSNLGIDEVKLSKSYIQEIRVWDIRETMKTKLSWDLTGSLSIPMW